MMLHPALLHFGLIVSVLVACVGAWIIAPRYRRRMRQLMSAPPVALSTDSAPEPELDGLPPARVSLADNRGSGIGLTLLLVAVSCLMAVSSASIWWTLSVPDEPMLPKRVAVIAFLHLWPVIPALALVWRWSGTRLFGAVLLWCGLCFVIMLWRQIERNPVQALAAMVSEIGLSLVLVSLVFLGNATRAIAPWLLIPSALLMWAALAGLDGLMSMAQRQAPPLMWVLGVFGWSSLFIVPLLFIVLLVALAWWPARALGRALGRAYSRKWLSDLLVVFAGVWAFALTDRTLTVANSIGVEATALYLPLLWIPAALWLAGRWRPRRGRPPTLLVLRVFQQDAKARGLFDHVVERWRLSGNTVLIAGTDLADRTLDAHDIFRFLDGKLAERFIASPEDVTRRIAGFDMVADVDGRHRVNECYCHDTTWQDALRALVSRSDVVLMDLRGFQAHNAGCRYELGTLAGASRELRVVVLTDARTDRAAAQEALGSGRRDRFTWVDASHFRPSKRREVLARLFA
jgi:hypothetical protein